MVRIMGALLIVGTALAILIGVVTLYDETLQVGRMWETPALKPYEQPLPVAGGLSVPAGDAEVFYRTAAPDALKAPFDLAAPQTIAGGKLAYGYYCIQCHGVNYDGYGTVGQSFAPKPRDLESERVQNLPAGRLFHEISYGIPGGRQPPLDTTMSVNERWQVIGFIKSLGVRP